ncbi:MAG: hypothetical protein F6K17_23780 [Okeania sp. SIO3C4]|nr:hypothetical protein [Okeania sp. SIO3B3]NER05392.1 hypothetical protein [Okeania sp. SIO3C4]
MPASTYFHRRQGQAGCLPPLTTYIPIRPSAMPNSEYWDVNFFCESNKRSIAKVSVLVYRGDRYL